FLEPGRALAAFEVEFERARAMALGLLDEAGRGVDRARSTDRDEQVGPGERGVDFVHPVGHLAEPHDVRAQRRLTAGGTRRASSQRSLAAVPRVAGGAPG